MGREKERRVIINGVERHESKNSFALALLSPHALYIISMAVATRTLTDSEKSSGTRVRVGVGPTQRDYADPFRVNEMRRISHPPSRVSDRCRDSLTMEQTDKLAREIGQVMPILSPLSFADDHCKASRCWLPWLSCDR